MRVPTTSRWAVVTALLLTPVWGSAPAASAAELGITLTHLRVSTVELVVVCPVDPPTTAIVLAGASRPVVVGTLPISCVGGGRAQTVVVPLTTPFTAGARVDLSATVSGDSGEINASFPASLVAADATSSTRPARPIDVRVRVGSTTAVVTWRVPSPARGAAATGFRVWRRGHLVNVPASTRRVVLRGLRAGRSYVIRIAAHNQSGWSETASLTVRATSSRP